MQGSYGWNWNNKVKLPESLSPKAVLLWRPGHEHLDIEYFAHFCDPEGFKIELIDYRFQNQERKKVVNRALLGGGAHLSLLTLRGTDIENT